MMDDTATRTGEDLLDQRGHDADAVMESLRRVVHALRTLTVHAERTYGVTAAQLFVLRQIARQPGLSLHALALRTHTRDSSVSEVVSRLVQTGLVERHPAPWDRRRIRLTLGPEGERVVALAPETVQERLVRAFHALPDATAQSLARGLEQWVAIAGLHDQPHTMFFEWGAAERSNDAERERGDVRTAASVAGA